MQSNNMIQIVRVSLGQVPRYIFDDFIWKWFRRSTEEILKAIKKKKVVNERDKASVMGLKKSWLVKCVRVERGITKGEEFFGVGGCMV